jgi:phage gp16-like protein
MPSRAALAKIHIATKELGFSDEAYRDLLLLQFKVESASKLTEQQAASLLDIFRRKGWKPKKSRQQPGQKRRNGSFIEIKPGPAAAQQRKVLALWNALGYDLDKLHTRCSRQFGVDRFEWLTEPRHLHVLITDLESRMD